LTTDRLPVPAATRLPEGLVAELSLSLGDRFSTTAAVRDHHSRDESYRAPAAPDAVCFPITTEEVREIVNRCARYRIPVISFGAGTSLEGHVIAPRGGVCLDMTRMNRVLRVAAEDMDATVEAGITRKQLNHALRDTGLCFFIDPGADATIGGMTATRASGTTAVRYGTMKDNVLGLTVVLADGRVIRTGGRARKSSAGYDLTRLFVGSEGTLGVITEITLRLHLVPEAISAAVCSFATMAGAVDTATAVIQAGIPVARIELLDEPAIDAVNHFAGLDLPVTPTLFFEFHGVSEANVVEQAQLAEAAAGAHGGQGFQWATQAEDRSRLWKARHEAYYAILAWRPGTKGWTTDVCVPISRLTEAVLAAKKDLSESSLKGALVGHVGDGNFHMVYLVDPAGAGEIEEARRLSDRMVLRALEAGGTCTGEHGIVMGKMEYLVREHGEAVEIMRDLKHALDPLNLMNPGKMLRG
jgi:D-lactate dehydrogenase (cytochrome)